MENPRESLIDPEILNNATVLPRVLPDNSAANATITTNIPSEDKSAFTAGSTGIIEQGTAESRQRTSFSLSLVAPWKTSSFRRGFRESVGVEERFSFDIGEDDFESLKKGKCPANTARSTEWAMKNFEMWRIARNLC